MIICTDEYIYKKNKKCKPKRRKFSVFLLVFVLLIAGFFYNRFVIERLIYNYSREKIIDIFYESANSAVNISLSLDYSYDDFITIHKNEKGEVSLLQTNSILINKINREIISKTTKIMSDKIDSGVTIPALAFTGITFLSGYGPEVKFRALNVRQVNSEFKSDFKTAGINQTVHSLYFDVECTLFVDFPFNKMPLSSKVSVLVFESLIIGKVPQLVIGGINNNKQDI